MLKIRRVEIFSMAVLFAAVLTACSSQPVADEDSAFYAVPVGSRLQLHQAVTIPPDQVAVWVQDGKLLPESDVNKYRPNCKFEVYKISEQARTVAADNFEITRVEDDIETSALPAEVQLAALEVMLSEAYLALGALDHSEVFNYATLMYLHSERQKDVYRMTCQHWESVMDDRYLSISQMRQAMGEVFSLTLKTAIADEAPDSPVR